MQIPPRLKMRLNNEQGFSFAELLIVMFVISILSVLSLLAFKSEKKFLADTEAYLIMDVINEARQRALTQHEIMRVEINKTRNIINLINENAAGNAADDKIIKTLALQHPNYVVFDTAPTNATAPTDSAPVPPIVFKTSTHPLSLSDQVATLRFLQNGNVVDGGSNAVGSNSVITGATIYVWMPNYSGTGQPLTTGNVIRAITILGSTGSAKYWKCPGGTEQCPGWIQ